mmetsp:Transcript_81576/g.162320  ORF Transcript_81576/g.162320 Transcript_81576/m.162320 type:complete len:227 (-) Transcript_81576:249-929(-)
MPRVEVGVRVASRAASVVGSRRSSSSPDMTRPTVATVEVGSIPGCAEARSSDRFPRLIMRVVPSTLNVPLERKRCVKWATIVEASPDSRHIDGRGLGIARRAIRSHKTRLDHAPLSLTKKYTLHWLDQGGKGSRWKRVVRMVVRMVVQNGPQLGRAIHVLSRAHGPLEYCSLPRPPRSTLDAVLGVEERDGSRGDPGASMTASPLTKNTRSTASSLGSNSKHNASE